MLTTHCVRILLLTGQLIAIFAGRVYAGPVKRKLDDISDDYGYSRSSRCNISGLSNVYLPEWNECAGGVFGPRDTFDAQSRFCAALGPNGHLFDVRYGDPKMKIELAWRMAKKTILLNYMLNREVERRIEVKLGLRILPNNKFMDLENKTYDTWPDFQFDMDEKNQSIQWASFVFNHGADEIILEGNTLSNSYLCQWDGLPRSVTDEVEAQKRVMARGENPTKSSEIKVLPMTSDNDDVRESLGGSHTNIGALKRPFFVLILLLTAVLLYR